MLAQILSAILLFTLGLHVNCVPVKRSLFDISPFQIKFSPNLQTTNPNSRQSNNPLFPVPDFQAPFQFAGKIFNNNNNNFLPRRYYDASENSLNGRVQMKYKMSVNFNPANEEPGKEHTTNTALSETTTLLTENEILLAGHFYKDNNDVTPQNTDSTSDSDTTESTTEFETTTTDDLLNRMAIPSSVLASLAG
ncbi:uncharacterized protein LOC121730868 [Aricia agestis]|uniref:uncharacterized protein LOC121730868 n=1 Tax=Aricia agestis TaxID=91739 RepID=UPI001C2064E0|nr:uncharacterized protein LOC121730868 [Aricia agestis]